MSNPSQKVANDAVRVLSGTRLKFTCRLMFSDGREYEFQADNKPTIAWHSEDRSLWIYNAMDTSYNQHPICRWLDGMLLFVEENEKVAAT